jgi:hypothetical protein
VSDTVAGAVLTALAAVAGGALARRATRGDEGESRADVERVRSTVSPA